MERARASVRGRDWGRGPGGEKHRGPGRKREAGAGSSRLGVRQTAAGCLDRKVRGLRLFARLGRYVLIATGSRVSRRSLREHSARQKSGRPARTFSRAGPIARSPARFPAPDRRVAPAAVVGSFASRAPPPDWPMAQSAASAPGRAAWVQTIPQKLLRQLRPEYPPQLSPQPHPRPRSGGSAAMARLTSIPRCQNRLANRRKSPTWASRKPIQT